MIKLKRKIEPSNDVFPFDTDKLMILFNEKGYIVSRDDVIWAYENYCQDHFCISWLSIENTSNEILKDFIECSIIEYLEPILKK